MCGGGGGLSRVLCVARCLKPVAWLLHVIAAPHPSSCNALRIARHGSSGAFHTWGRPEVACCMLQVACCMLCVGRCMSYVACCMLSVASCMLPPRAHVLEAGTHAGTHARRAHEQELTLFRHCPQRPHEAVGLGCVKQPVGHTRLPHILCCTASIAAEPAPACS